MPTPKDAPYKLEQQDLRRRAKATPGISATVDSKGSIINPARRAKKAKKAAK